MAYVYNENLARKKMVNFRRFWVKELALSFRDYLLMQSSTSNVARVRKLGSASAKDRAVAIVPSRCQGRTKAERGSSSLTAQRRSCLY